MNYQIKNYQKNPRIPNETIYNIILTLALAFAIVWIIYITVPYTHYRFYLIEESNKK
jgi:hypothetical protein